MAYLTASQLSSMGFKSIGENVLISDKACIYRPHLMEIGSNVRIDDFCIVSGNVKLGNYVHIYVYSHLSGGAVGVQMDDFSTLAHNVRVFTESDDYSGESLTNAHIPEKYKPKRQAKAISIGRHCIVGANSLIFPGASLQEGSAVGAMSLVNKPTEPWAIYAGVPAKKIKNRSKKLLELEKEFLNEVEGS